MKTTDRLIAAAWDIWNGYCEHPFVLEMRDGVLERDKFRHYIVQDYFYLIDYARVFALGAAKAPDVETMRAFAAMCSEILECEMNTHNGYMGVFGLTEEELSRYLYTGEENGNMPDPDLIIRTSGEERLSNFLLWQAAYSEFAFTDTLWPDFTPQELEDIITAYRSRERRFGGRKQEG